MMVIPFYDNNIIKKKFHILCKLVGHSYQSVAWINHCDNMLSGYSVCKRCGDVSVSTTFGPFHIVIKGDEP